MNNINSTPNIPFEVPSLLSPLNEGKMEENSKENTPIEIGPEGPDESSLSNPNSLKIGSGAARASRSQKESKKEIDPPPNPIKVIDIKSIYEVGKIDYSNLINLKPKIKDNLFSYTLQLLEDNFKKNLESLTNKTTYRISLIGSVGSGKTLFLKCIGQLFEAGETETFDNKRRYTTYGLNFYRSKWKPNLESIPSSEKSDHKPEKSKIYPETTICFLDTEGIGGGLPRLPAMATDETAKKLWSVSYETATKNKVPTIHNSKYEYVRSDGIKKIVFPAVYNLSDMVIFVSTGSLSSIAYRDELYAYICNIMDRTSHKNKPTLLLISNQQNDNSEFDLSSATKSFMTLHDPRGELLLFFKEIRVVRMPLVPPENPYIPSSKENETKQLIFEKRKLFYKLIEKIHGFINQDIMKSLDNRDFQKITITEKINLTLIKNTFDKLENTSEWIDSYTMLNEVIIPTGEITQIINYHFQSIFTLKMTDLTRNEKFELAVKYLNKLIKVYYFNKVVSLSAELKEELLKNQEDSNIFKDLLINVEKTYQFLEELMIEYKPCTNYTKLPKENITTYCGIPKSSHNHTYLLEVHQTGDRISDFHTWPKQEVGLLAWRRMRWIPKDENGNFRSNKLSNEYFVKFKPHLHLWYWMGKYQTQESTLKNDRPQKSTEFLKPIIDYLVSQDIVTRENILGDDEAINEVYKIAKGNIKAATEYPTLPCFSCLKTDDKKFVGEIVGDHNPITVPNSSLICCSDCLGKFKKVELDKKK